MTSQYDSQNVSYHNILFAGVNVDMDLFQPASKTCLFLFVFDMTDRIQKTTEMYHPLRNISFEGYTLIVPSVSVGNVGQLCADLLIQSLQCEKAGYFWHPSILPVVGTDPYNVSSSKLSLSAEVYCSEGRKLVILQLRSSIIKRLRKEFLKEMILWVKSSGIKQVAILTGSSNEERIDEQIVSEPFRYLVSSELHPSLDVICRSLGWIALERRLQFPALSKIETLGQCSGGSGGQIVIPGGGFAKQLFDLCTENNIPSIAFIKFCSEGDNIPDAVVMMTKLNDWLNLLEDNSKITLKVVFPPSWSHLFGSPPPRELY